MIKNNMPMTSAQDTGMGPTAIEFGPYEIDTTCASSPYPAEFSGVPKLYICEFCLEYTADASDFKTHTTDCNRREPCGTEIYCKDGLSVFEVDGAAQPRYCTNLCLHMKLFIDDKRKDFDVEDFHYYILTVNSCAEAGKVVEKHIAGYFSKEKLPVVLNNNLSCVLILPQFQRQGYGRFLVDFSYALSRAEKMSGTPEKPLSRVGLATYQSYWRSRVGKFLYENRSVKSISVKSMSERTGIDPYDIADTLQMMNFVKERQGKLSIVIKEKALKEQISVLKQKKHIEVDEDCLQWKPPPPSLLPSSHSMVQNESETKTKGIDDSTGIETNEGKDSNGGDSNDNSMSNNNIKSSNSSSDDLVKSTASNKNSNNNNDSNLSNPSSADHDNSNNESNASCPDEMKINVSAIDHDEVLSTSSEKTTNSMSNSGKENKRKMTKKDEDGDEKDSSKSRRNDKSENVDEENNNNGSRTRRNLRKHKNNPSPAIQEVKDENNNDEVKPQKNDTGKRRKLRSMASDEDKEVPQPPPMKTRLRRGTVGSR